MDSVSYNKMCEDAAFGEFLIDAIAKSIGIEPDGSEPAFLRGRYLREKIDRAIYKGTDCGAWVRFDEKGIMVGTIVEGSDAEYSERVHVTDDEQELCQRFWAAIARCEEFAEEYFGKD